MAGDRRDRRVKEGDAVMDHPLDWLCPTCGGQMYDMRGVGFNVHQITNCVYIGNGDYTCVRKQQARDSRVNITPVVQSTSH